ncbi:putative small multi-drug export protein [Caprobacter fermentans]|uniref:Small multi-drug export protein n=1 Tax=Caproicibacter fermentans TaxID=2576756 RepID=A0A6N8HWY9_9FIRM|nr:small multi-drug export protein [Caproicibacter fermentans]MVB10115.1 putative small multi-drug export protein [Caproicibacter fermentans]OCN03379.1 small multi-drug export protein [Clostridium sp. W14A]QNK40185.1 small multi-drug export protein [Caproicibacter fermentans]
MDQLVTTLINALRGIPAELIVFLISLLPLLELRGGILAAGLLHVGMIRAFFICLAGTLLPVPFILLFFRKILDWLRNTRFVRLVRRLEDKMNRKSKQIEKYKTFGLLLFVAIPLPGTGAWTGSAAAALIGMKFRHALISVVLGCVVADVIMCLLAYGVLGSIL